MKNYIDIIFEPGDGPASYNETYIFRYFEEGRKNYYQDGRSAGVDYGYAQKLSLIPSFWYDELPDFNNVVYGDKSTQLIIEIRIMIKNILKKYCLQD